MSDVIQMTDLRICCASIWNNKHFNIKVVLIEEDLMCLTKIWQNSEDNFNYFLYFPQEESKRVNYPYTWTHKVERLVSYLKFLSNVFWFINVIWLKKCFQTKDQENTFPHFTFYRNRYVYVYLYRIF